MAAHKVAGVAGYQPNRGLLAAFEAAGERVLKRNNFLLFWQIIFIVI